MLCRRCERRLWSPRLMKFWTPSRRVWGARRLGDLLCARCGAVLPMELVTEHLLEKLSVLLPIVAVQITAAISCPIDRVSMQL